MVYYAVIDTNVIVSALLSKRSDSATVEIIRAVRDGKILPLYSEDILREYDEVLHRKKFKFAAEDIREMLGSIIAHGIEITPSPTGEILIDMKDLMFYEVVMEKRDNDAHLVTGNKKHFPIREYIVTPAEMMEKIKGV